MTLVEMIVAISIFLIGMEGFTILFVRSWQSNSFIMEEGQASLAASRGVERTVDTIRKARQSDNGEYLILSADEFDLVVYSDVDSDGDTERVHYFLDGDDFNRGVTEPSGNPAVYPAGDQTVTLLADYVVNEASDPIFSYYNRDYPGDTTNNPLATPADVGDIGMIKVHLLVNIDPVHAPDNINIQSFARLRNINN